MLDRTSRGVPDVPTLLCHPTGPHLAAFILPLVGRGLRPPRLPDECTTTCDMVRSMLKRSMTASGLVAVSETLGR